MDKSLIRVPLDELRTYDEEVLGQVFRRDGKAFRWVKNAGSTSLVADGACLTVLTSVEGNQLKRVMNPDTAGVTAIQELPAGVPMAAFGPSGSDTGSYGYIQVAGTKKVSMMQSSSAQGVGSLAIATASQPATAPWGISHGPTFDSATQANVYAKRVVLMFPMATTGPATAVSAIVDIQCL